MVKSVKKVGSKKVARVFAVGNAVRFSIPFAPFQAVGEIVSVDTGTLEVKTADGRVRRIFTTEVF